jgi:hypothetical protein
MLRVVVHFLDRAEAAAATGADPEAIAALDVLATLRRLGEEFGEDRIGDIEQLWNEIDDAFHQLQETEDAVR